MVDKSATSQGWLHQRERGTKLALRLMGWIALRLGRAPARALLYPICVYFLFSSGRARQASRDYLERALGRRVGLTEVFRHYHFFSATILDRAFLLTDRYDMFEVKVCGADLVFERAQKGQGCILLGAHLGSFEILRTLGTAQAHLPIRILMYEDNARKVVEVAKALNPALASTIITLGAVDSMLRVKEELDQGSLVGLLGDRARQHEKTVRCQFLDRAAVFSAGPMLLAATLKVPVLLCFGLYQGGNRYVIHCELFSERVELSRTRRAEELQRWTQRYADRLEHYCRLAPYNWFNFYDFWAEASL
jgi:predicted LPLAT superfamily acyltransferase